MSATVEPPTFTCDVEPDRDRARLVLAGELDLATVERLFELTRTEDALPFVEAR